MANDEWKTPKWFFDWCNFKFGPFTLDAAASDENHLCEKYYTQQNSGLKNPWDNYGVTWCNPPYSDIQPWVIAAMGEMVRSRRSVLLLPSRTSRDWYSQCFTFASIGFITNGRIKFIDPTTAKRTAPMEDSILVGFGIQVPQFIDITQIAPKGEYREKEK